jgi:hypothetical protein
MIGYDGRVGGLAGPPDDQVPDADDAEGQSVNRQQPQSVKGEAGKYTQSVNSRGQDPQRG